MNKVREMKRVREDKVFAKKKMSNYFETIQKRIQLNYLKRKGACNLALAFDYGELYLYSILDLIVKSQMLYFLFKCACGMLNLLVLN